MSAISMPLIPKSRRIFKELCPSAENGGFRLLVGKNR